MILLHVLSAIVGVGPAFFSPILFRSKQNKYELTHSLAVGKRLDLFPKIGGSIAMLSGLALFFLNDYGAFTQLWLIGSLILYLLIQIVVIAYLLPAQKKLTQSVFNTRDKNLTHEQTVLLTKVRTLSYSITTLGLILFTFMIIKP